MVLDRYEVHPRAIVAALFLGDSCHAGNCRVIRHHHHRPPSPRVRVLLHNFDCAAPDTNHHESHRRLPDHLRRVYSPAHHLPTASLVRLRCRLHRTLRRRSDDYQ